jgi:bifunctional DNA-binding transcriptional regulator/antitoxin component of YhaV-PrlF toxin-antitoxin module
MSTILAMNSRGTLTIPLKARRRLGLEKGGMVFMEETERGVAIVPGTFLPVEIYSDERIKEFDEEERILGKHLARRGRSK